ncbi:MAG TPA: cupin domain-containing protein [Methylocystis sp.]|nr:cupin domain-containing protein [Methylocystis sp.]
MKSVVIGALTGLLFATGSLLAADEIGAHKVFLPQEIQWGTGPASLPAGAQMAVLYGDPQKSGIFVLRVKLPKGYKIAPHMHKQSEILTVISGSLDLGLGPAADHASVETLPAGGFSSMPHGVVHYVLVNEDSTVQISANGPWSIEYVNPKDDPRLNGVPDPTSELYSSRSQ